MITRDFEMHGWLWLNCVVFHGPNTDRTNSLYFSSKQSVIWGDITIHEWCKITNTSAKQCCPDNVMFNFQPAVQLVITCGGGRVKCQKYNGGHKLKVMSPIKFSILHILSPFFLLVSNDISNKYASTITAVWLTNVVPDVISYNLKFSATCLNIIYL